MKIKNFEFRKVLNNRLEWTLEVEINGFKGISPSGASKGKNEVISIDVDRALKILGNLKEELTGKNFSQESLDSFLAKKGGNKFRNIGGNTSIAISFAFFNANFNLKGNIFPYPLGNVVGGKSHGGFSDIQEFLVLPVNSKTIYEAIETNIVIYKEVRNKFGGKKIGVNDEGALMIKEDHEKILDILCNIAENFNAKVGLDVAASSLWNGNGYEYESIGKILSPEEQIDFIKSLIEKYNLYYIEDPFHEEDFKSFKELNDRLGKKCLICGDDLTVTDYERIKKAHEINAINSVIIKPNQIGTITLSKKALEFSRKNKILPIISHRSGETDDVTISRLSVNWQIPVIKCGIFGIRTLKLNELIRLWDKCENPKMVKL